MGKSLLFVSLDLRKKKTKLDTLYLFIIYLQMFLTSYHILNSKHLTLFFQGVQERANLTSPMLSKEDPIFGSLSHKLGHNIDEVGHRIHQALLRVRSALITCLIKISYFSKPLGLIYQYLLKLRS